MFCGFLRGSFIYLLYFCKALNTDKKHIQHLAAICQAKGVSHAVISPGSRCAPLIIAFNRMEEIECISVIDERSAGFIALGIAQQTKKVVALICTSGSAILNYAPALAEAFYQKVPLLVLSADRPNEWIDQGENQSINQNEVYKNYIKKSYNLPVQVNTEKDLWYSDRIIAEAINTCLYPDFGPVHINIPLREPLYNLTEEPAAAVKNIEFLKPVYSLEGVRMKKLAEEWQSYDQIMIVVGGLKERDANLENILQKLSKRSNIVVLKEAISNVYGEYFIDQIDQNVEVINNLNARSFVPDLVVTLGGGVVSKKLKFWLRAQKVLHHWHITSSFEHWDIFQGLSKVLQHDAVSFFEFMYTYDVKHESSYRQDWHDLNKLTRKVLNDFLAEEEFADFTVFNYLIHTLPKQSILQLGNSTPVRYANLLSIDSEKEVAINSNRGVSGIDGILSTALGASIAHPEKLCFCICGDVSSLYDSNALMSVKLSPKLKLIIINNQGGNIFKIIPGPDKLNELEHFFETKHDYEFKHLAEMYGCSYFKVSNMRDLENSFLKFVEVAGESAILEIRTNGDLSAQMLRRYFERLKEEVTLK